MFLLLSVHLSECNSISRIECHPLIYDFPVLFYSIIFLYPNSDYNVFQNSSLMLFLGVQSFSGRVLDSRQKGHRFEPHRRHCVVSLSKTHLSMFSTGSPRKTRPGITERLLTGM